MGDGGRKILCCGSEENIRYDGREWWHTKMTKKDVAVLGMNSSKYEEGRKAVGEGRGRGGWKGGRKAVGEKEARQQKSSLQTTGNFCSF